MNELKVGVVGYSAQKFDEEEASKLISKAYDIIDSQSIGRPKTIVSGLTNLGIPALAYKEAVNRGWRTIGVACSKAEEYDCFPVDERQIVGNEWGDESDTFLNQLEILVRIGGGKQSMNEIAEMKKRGMRVLEYDLPSQK